MTGERPGFEDFQRLAAGRSMVPVWRELLGDLETPVGAFRKLGDQDGRCCWSVEHGERWGLLVHRHRPVRHPDHPRRPGLLDRPPPAACRRPPLEVLREALRRLRSPSLPGLPPRCSPGPSATSATTWSASWSGCPTRPRTTSGCPRGCWSSPARWWSSTTWASAWSWSPTWSSPRPPTWTPPTLTPSGASTPWPRGCRCRSRPCPPAALGRPAGRGRQRPRPRPLPGDGPDRQGAHRRRRHRQVVPSQRFSVPTTADPLDVYQVLRVVNPSPYMYFLHLPG